MNVNLLYKIFFTFFICNIIPQYDGLFNSVLRHRREQVLQIGFIHGSQIHNEFYQPFLETLQNELRITVNITYLPYLPKKLENNTIIIGHSFGGFFGLLYCIMDESNSINNVKGCILINSHFNERYKMPYIGIKQNRLTIPVLTLLNKDDDKLPIEKALDDYYLSIKREDMNKMFIVNPGNHTSTFVDKNEMKIICRQIKKFLSQHKLY